ncbi:MAG: MarR family transcriptional regulator [Candidatus Bathyarchaeia archaeon]
MSALEDVKAEFIRYYEDVSNKRGLPTLFGRIMGVFFLEGRELTQKEISDLTGYSISSVSRTLDQMVRMGLVQRHKDPSIGSFAYRMSINYLDLAVHGLGTWIRQAEESLQNLRNIRQKMSSIKIEEGEEAEFDRIYRMLRDIEEKGEIIIKIIKRDIEELVR